MAAGDEHSAPLKVKYHRLQQLWQLPTRKSPFQKTRKAVLSDFFLKMHSYGMIKITLKLKIVINNGLTVSWNFVPFIFLLFSFLSANALNNT